MSRISRYLKQTAIFQPVLRNEKGEPILNEYGEPTYGDLVTVKCRREVYKSKSSTGYGLFVNYLSTYYVDETVKPHIDDKLDGNLVQNVNQYVDGSGKLVGYEVQV